MSQAALIYGGCGALGRTLVSYFKEQGWAVTCVDLSANEDATANVVLDVKKSLDEQAEAIRSVIKEQKFDGIFTVAGGWAGGDASSKELLKNCELMVSQSIYSSFIASSIASTNLKETGVLVLTGAKPALGGTSFMLAYGAAKAAVHQLVQGLGQKNSGLPEKATALAILPVTIDTPMNRKFMADADFTTWTPRERIAEEFKKWASEADKRPATGSLVTVETKDGSTSFNVQ